MQPTTRQDYPHHWFLWLAIRIFAVVFAIMAAIPFFFYAVETMILLFRRGDLPWVFLTGLPPTLEPLAVAAILLAVCFPIPRTA